MSSKRRIRRNQCGRKARHPSEAGAKVAIAKLRRAYGGAIGYLNAYKCPHCGAWHVGHARGGR
ncbi:hypothetical protein [Ottowia sp.]|uniref:hypothetical protein n=1 Tax=Ottowia sp. TaxID=1898956 RepID=UPI003A890FC2